MNEQDLIEDIQYLPGLGLSDHLCLEFSFRCYCQYYTSVNKPRFNLHSVDFTTMCQLISNVDWEDALNPFDLHNAWDYFSATFNDIVLKCIPLEVPRPKKIFI